MITPQLPGISIKKSRPGLMLLFVFLFINIPALLGQKNELGVFFGGSYYLGDLNPGKQFAMTRIALGGIYRYNFNPHLSARVNGIFASVEGNDALIKYNEDRNLRFVSRITELTGQVEVNFLPFVAGNLDTPYSPYIFFGGGVFSFNPQAQLPDDDGRMRWINLRPLGTEGQGNENYPDRELYSLVSSNFLFGIGFKFNISRNITGGLEWGMRRTGTDYLDDVSTTYADLELLPSATTQYFADRSLSNPGQNTGLQRGDPTTNDWYSFAGFVLAFKIKDFTRGKCAAYN